MSDLPLGVLAEGAGGVHVARLLRATMPKEDVAVLCDQAYAPYAARPSRVVADRTARMPGELGPVKLLLVASVQAGEDALGAIAAAAGVPTLGLEATLPFAAVRSRTGRIAAVYAAGTIRERPWLKRNRFQRGVEVVPVPWPGLREAIDAGRLPAEGPDLPADADVAALVCPYASAAAALVIGAEVFDGSVHAAARVQRQLVRMQAYARRRRHGRIVTLSSSPVLAQSSL